jgi:hypothetical protein
MLKRKIAPAAQLSNLSAKRRIAVLRRSSQA